MSIENVRRALLWCAIINFGILGLWAVLWLGWHEPLQRLTGRWFRMPAEQFDALNYAGILLYKIGILLFNLVPYVALRIVT